MRYLLLCLALLCPVIGQAQKNKTPFARWMVVIDPGHGGTDPGSHAVHQGKSVVENEYVYDVALRVQRLIRSRGGIAPMTVIGEKTVRNFPPSQIFDDDQNERFALNGKVVQAGSRGLNTRVRYGNAMKSKYSQMKQLWISIHFDVVGSDEKVSGIRVITSDTASRITKALSKGFSSAGRLREKDPVVLSGDKDHGIRHIYVLGKKNLIRDKVLIELGNFLNDSDLWRIRSPDVREKYARAIADALCN